MKSAQGIRINNGKSYEEAATAFLRRRYGNTLTVIPNAKIRNDDGGFEQIDILLESCPHPETPLYRIAVEAKNYKRRLTKKDVRDAIGKFKQIEATHGMIVSSSELQSGAQAEIDKARRPRIEVYVKSRIELIEGAWSVDFLEALPLLRAAKTDQEPSRETIDHVILAIEAIAYYSKYFFHDLRNPAWIPILSSRGVFERCYSDESEVNPLAIAEYLGSFTADYPKEFIAFARCLRHPDGRIEGLLMESAYHLPDKFRAEFIELASDWNYINFIWTDAAAALIELEARHGQISNGLSLVAKMCEVIEEPSRNRNNRYRRPAVPEGWLDHITQDLFPKLAAIEPIQTLRFARDLYRTIFSAIHPDHHLDLHTWYLPHVGETGRFKSLYPWLTFIFNYRDALLSAAEFHPEATLSEIRLVLNAPEIDGAARCCIFAVSKRFEAMREMFDEILSFDRLWRLEFLRPELETLIEDNWSKLTETQRERTVYRILGLGVFEYPSDIESQEAERWRKVNVTQWLAVLAPLGWPSKVKQEAESVFEELKRETNCSMRALRTGTTAYFVDSIPEEAKHFEELQANEVLDICASFQSREEALHPKSPRGVAQRLKEAISNRPSEFLEYPNQILELPHHCYHAAVIEGLSEAIGKQPRFDISTICTLIQGIIRQPARENADRRDLFEYGTHTDVFTAATHFIEDASNDHHACESANSLSSLLRVWESLFEVSSSAADVIQEDAEYEPGLEHSLNSFDGRLSLALCALSLRAKRMERTDLASGCDRSCVDQAYSDAKRWIDKFILHSPLARVRCSLSSRFFEFYSLDPDYVEPRIERIFDRELQSGWATCWTTYLMYSHWSKDTFMLLKPQYEYSLTLMDDALPAPMWAEGLGGHFAIAWMTGLLGKQDLLFQSFLAESHPECLAASAFHIQHHVRENDDESIWHRAIEYWRMVVDQRPNVGGEALSRMLFWIKGVPTSISAESIEILLLASLMVEDSLIPSEVFEFLLQRAATEPLPVARILRFCADLEGRYMLTQASSDMKDALRTCFAYGDADVKRLALDTERRMLIRGIVSFEGTVSAL